MNAGQSDGGRSLSGRRAVVYDPHPLTLEAICGVLARMEIAVVAATTSAEDAVAACSREEPDLFVTSNESLDGSTTGYASLRAAHDAVPELRSIVLSRHDEPQQIEAAFAAGANAYVVRTAEPEDLAAAIRQAFIHSVYLPHTRTLGPPEPRPQQADDSPGLTRREIEILTLVAEGHSNGELAQMLWVTEQTVKFHLSNIYRKLGVANRTEAGRWAHVHGLLSADARRARVNR